MSDELLTVLIDEVKAMRLAMELNGTGAVKPATLTREEAAAYLGVHPDTLYRWARENRIAYVRMGEGEKAPMRFTLEDLDRYLQECRIEAL